MDKSYLAHTLVEELGIKENSRIIFLNPPIAYLESLKIPQSTIVEENSNDGREGQFDLVQFFAQDKKELEDKFPKLKELIKKDGALWISWKKGKIDPFAHLNENKIREIGLLNGLVDIKVISIDEIWSGLKFVWRVKDR